MSFAELVAARPASPTSPTSRPTGRRTEVAVRICADLVARVEVLLDLGLGYLSLGRSSTTLSPGEAQRLRIATQLRSGLFGVVYVLDEPSAGLHPADAEPLLDVLDRAQGVGQLAVRRRARPRRRTARRLGRRHRSGRRARAAVGCSTAARSPASSTSRSRSPATTCSVAPSRSTTPRRTPHGWLHLRGVTRHNLARRVGRHPAVRADRGHRGVRVGQVDAGHARCSPSSCAATSAWRPTTPTRPHLEIDVDDASGLESFDRLVRVDQRPIGRTPRSNLATYTGMFDAVRKLYAATDEAQARGYGAGRFSFNVAEGRCETCQGEGFVSVELLFLPGTYAPCPTCHGARYNAETLEITYRGKNIADVLALSVDEAAKFLADVPAAARSLETLREVGLGYLRLGQPATELSGGEAQRIKLATELQRARRGHALYLLDEPTAGLHPADIALLLRQLHRLVDAGNTVVLVEHDLDTIATADWVIDLGPGGGDAGGQRGRHRHAGRRRPGRGQRHRAVPGAPAGPSTTSRLMSQIPSIISDSLRSVRRRRRRLPHRLLLDPRRSHRRGTRARDATRSTTGGRVRRGVVRDVCSPRPGPPRRRRPRRC